MYMFLYVIKKELLHRRHVGYWQILLRFLHWIFTRVLEKKLLAIPEHLSSSPFNSVCNFQCSILSTIVYLYGFFFSFWTLYCLFFDLQVSDYPFGVFKLFGLAIVLYVL